MVVVVADQLTKLWAVGRLTDAPSMEILGDFLRFSLVYNEGGAMGTRLGPSVYYLFMALLVLPLVLWYVYRNRHTLVLSLPLSFIAAGAIGNLIDRIRLDKVIDFIDVDFFDINIDWLGFHMDRFWIFNIADAAISCAITFLLIYMLLNRHRFDAPAGAPPEPPADTAPPS